MTSCVGVKLEEGLILASDSRTHAGVDNYAKFCKMTVFEKAGDRVLVLLSSGGLAATQAVISMLRRRAAAKPPHLYTVPSMFDVANLVADAMRDLRVGDSPTGWNLAQCLPHALLKCCAAHVQRQVKAHLRRIYKADHLGHESLELRVAADQLCARESILQIAHELFGIVAEQDRTHAALARRHQDRAQ